MQLNGLVEKALVDADLAEADIGSAPRLMEIVMQSCRGRVDACIGTYIALALGRCASPLADPPPLPPANPSPPDPLSMVMYVCPGHV